MLDGQLDVGAVEDILGDRFGGDVFADFGIPLVTHHNGGCAKGDGVTLDGAALAIFGGSHLYTSGSRDGTAKNFSVFHLRFRCCR